MAQPESRIDGPVTSRAFFNEPDMNGLKPDLGKGIYTNNKDKYGKDDPPYYPSIFTDPAIKQTAAYALAGIKALYYNNWVNFNNAWGNNWRNRFIDNRNWSNGKWDIHAFTGGKKPKQDEKQNPMFKHLDFDPVTEQSQICDKLVGRLENMEYDVQANSLNPTAAATRENERLNEIMIHRMQASGFANQINQSAGQNIMPASNLPFPVTDEKEINLFYQLGGAKQVYEEEIEVANQVVLNDSDFNQIKKLQAEDTFNCGIIVEDTIYDRDGRIKVKYVDPVNEGVEDYRGHYLNRPDRIWYMELKTIQEIYMEAEGQITLKQMFELSRKFESKFGNPSWNASYNGWQQYYNTDSDYNFGVYSTFFYSWKVPAMYSRTSEVDMYETIEYMNANGFKVKTFVPAKETQDLKGPNAMKGTAATAPTTKNDNTRFRDFLKSLPSDGMYAPLPEQYDADGNLTSELGGEIVPDRLQLHRYYRCTWILNTEVVYDYGRVPFPARDPYNPRYEQCPMRHYRITQQPMAERVRTYAKKIYNIGLKIDNEVARLVPGGFAFNVKAMENISLGNGETLTIKHIFEIFNQTGNYFYADEAQSDMLGATRNKQHITPLPQSGFKEKMDALLGTINFYLSRIVATTGVADLVTQPQNLPVGIADQQQAGSENALSQMTSAFLFMAEKRALHVSERVRKVVEVKGEYSGYADAIGTGVLSFIKVTPKVVPHRMGIRVSAKPSAKEKDMMRQYIGQAFSNLASTEQGGLWVTDMLQFEEYVNAGLPFKLIRMMLAGVLQDRINKAQQDKMALIDRQVQGNNQQAQAAISAEDQAKDKDLRRQMVMVQFEADQQIRINASMAFAKGNVQLTTQDHKSILKRQEDMVKAGLNQQ